MDSLALSIVVSALQVFYLLLAEKDELPGKVAGDVIAQEGGGGRASK